MTPLFLVIGWIAAAVCAVIIVRHHAGYFRRTRPFSFGAFMETGGWIIFLLVIYGALIGGLEQSGTRIVEMAASVVGLLFVGIGGRLR
jgi:threonine/homoserine/homoserine lactone efflux protein